MKPVENTPAKEVPPLAAFAPRFLDGHARANRQKPSGIAANEVILRVHLVPALGHNTTKTVNKILTVLNVLLKKAVEWEVLDHVPCSIRVLPVSKGSTHSYDFDEFERLVTAARATDPRAYLLVPMADEAGVRLGEMVALKWGDIDLVKRQVCIQRSA